MPEFAPTPAQREAIENRGGALLVSAAAGSGKTRVLTERLLSHVTEGPSPREIDEFLVITYTRAAAAELRSRIADELARRTAEDPSDRRLRRQAVLLRRAQIGTIHSFCAALLRENCHLAALPPDFAVADEDRVRELRTQTLRRVMDEAYVSPDPEFLLLADTVGAGRDDARLADLVLTLYDKLQSHPRPDDWAEAQIAALSAEHTDAGETPWGRELLSQAREAALSWQEQLEAALARVGRDGCEDILRAYGPSLTETVGALAALAAACGRGWEAARAALPVPFPRLSPLRAPSDPEAAETLKIRREACKKAMARLSAPFAQSSEKLLRDLSRTAPAMRALLRLVMRFERAFSQEKRRRSLLDFSDLEHLTARLLTDADGSGTALAREVSRRYGEVMVDEYQDVSRVQDLIIRAVSGGGSKLFLVGDVKQSVYRFRLADPAIFLEKYLSYVPAEEAAPGQPRRVLLRENFRSRPEVLDAVNAVFRSLMSPALGDLRYDDAAALRPGASFPGSVPPPELTVLSAPDGDGDGDDAERPDRVRSEAAWVARRIRALVAEGTPVLSGGVLRPAEYGDVAVLLRSANVVGGVYRRELQRAGVPVQSEQSGGFFDAPEVAVMLSLLAVVDNPRQDVPLIAALRSPLFGFGADDLSRARLAAPEGDFFDAVTRCAAAGDGKCAAFLSALDEFRALAPDLETGALLRRIYDRLDCMALCAASPDGGAARDNLTALFTLSQRFEAGGWRGLHRFLDALRSMRERGEEPRAGVSEGGGAVRILSVHKSKGLEFPIVFLCDTARRFNKTDTRAAVLVHPELGLGPRLTDTERGIEYPTLARLAVASRLERETLSEELRLLYVAMTRARERLFITCCLSDAAGAVEKLRPSAVAPLAAPELRAMPSPAHWLICAALADGGVRLRLTAASAAPAAEAEAPAPEAPEAPQASAVPAPELPDLTAALSWAYPHPLAVTLPSKVTATELKSLGAADGENAELLPREGRTFRRPDFLRDRGRLTAAERGTAAHLALRYLDFARTASPEEIRGELARLTAEGRLSEREAKSVDADALFRLFASETGRRMRAAPQVRREFPFTLLVRAGELFPGGGDDELLLQGVVDCCLEEPGGLVVVDYKTDAVTSERAPVRARRYLPQMEAYSRALTRITGKPVRERILYFLRCGAAVSV